MVKFTAGSALEAAILAGPEALNKYISSGEIEELVDVMPFEDNSPSRPHSRNSSDRSKSPLSKRSRFDDARDHNAQMIYGTDLEAGANISQLMLQAQLQQQQQQQQASQQPFIPPLLALKVSQPENFTHPQRSPVRDQDFRGFNTFNEEQARPSPWANPVNPINNMPAFPPQVFNPNIFNTNQNVVPQASTGGNFNNFNDNQFGQQSSAFGVNGTGSSNIKNRDNNRSHSNRPSGGSRNNSDSYNRKSRDSNRNNNSSNRRQSDDRNNRSQNRARHNNRRY